MSKNIRRAKQPCIHCGTIVSCKIVKTNKSNSSNRTDIAIRINFAYPMILLVGNEQIPLTINRQAIGLIQG